MLYKKNTIDHIVLLLIYGTTMILIQESEAIAKQVESETNTSIGNLVNDNTRLTIDEKGIVTNNSQDLTVDRSSTANLSAGIHYLELVFPEDRVTLENVEANNDRFFVEQFKANSFFPLKSLEAADSLIAGNVPFSTASGYYETIDFLDAEGNTNSGNKHGGISFPGTSGDELNFAVRVTGNILIPMTGDWTFLTNNDDGVRLSIDGNNIIIDNALHPAKDILATTNLSAGVHSLELIFFENAGVASLELWAAPGRETDYNSNFKLVGDTANGGIATTTPIPFTFSSSIGIFLFLSLFGYNQVWKKLEKAKSK